MQPLQKLAKRCHSEKTLLQLPRSCQTFKCRANGREQTVYIVGTAHTSSASCDDVRAVIREVKPEVQHKLTGRSQMRAISGFDACIVIMQVVMLELCAERKDILTIQKQDVSLAICVLPGTAQFTTQQAVACRA